MDTTWPLVPNLPPPGRTKVDPVFSSAVDEAIAEVLDPTAPEKRGGKAATKDGSGARRGRGKKVPATQPPSESTPAPKSAGETGGSAERPGRGRKKQTTPPPAVNEPLAFIRFVAAYPVGTTVEGEVVSFTSHGAMVDVAIPGGGVLDCYIPLASMGTPPPTKARQVLAKGEVRSFVLAGLDPPRRVAELSLPEPRGVRADVDRARGEEPRRSSKATVKAAAPAPTKSAPKKAAAKKAAPKKPGTKKAASKKAVKEAAPKKAAGTKSTVKAVTKKQTAKKTASKKAVSRKVVAKKVAKKAAAKKTGAQP